MRSASNHGLHSLGWEQRDMMPPSVGYSIDTSSSAQNATEGFCQTGSMASSVDPRAVPLQSGDAQATHGARESYVESHFRRMQQSGSTLEVTSQNNSAAVRRAVPGPSPWPACSTDSAAMKQPCVAAPSPGVWSSPFSGAVGTLGGSGSHTVVGAIQAAAEAETHVRRGISAAHSWWPSLVRMLRQYFAVSHSSVSKKLLLLLLPVIGAKYIVRPPLDSANVSYLNSKQNFKPYDQPVDQLYGADSGVPNTGLGDDTGTEGEQMEHNIHHLGPDLYLPTMAFMSYILLYGLAKGTSDNFHPEILSARASFGAILIVVEVLFSALAFFLLGTRYVPFLDILSIAGQKFESLVPLLIIGLSAGGGGFVFWIAFMYCALCVSHSVFTQLRSSELRHRCQHDSNSNSWDTPQPPKVGFVYVVAFLSALQVPLMWFLIPSFSASTSRIARLASVQMSS